MIGLAPLGWLYGWLMQLRVWLYHRGLLRSKKLPGFVIAVGNLEVGGTGKSPVVMSICDELKKAGARPVVLSRGYRSGLAPKESAVLIGDKTILEPQSKRDFQADEARMQAIRLTDVPIIIGAKRTLAADRYLQHFPAPTHWILDDGFQHLKIKRDLNILLLDAHQPFDNHRCLPAGRLRENISALKRADLLFYTRADDGFPTPQSTEIVAPYKIPAFRVGFRDGTPLQVAGRSRDVEDVGSWGLALGIARPDRIQEALRKGGFSVSKTILVRDHSAFTPSALQDLADASDAILTTEKDYWRSPQAFLATNRPVFLLPLDVDIKDGQSLRNILSRFT